MFKTPSKVCDQVCADYQTGMTQKRVAVKNNLSPDTVCYILKRRGIKNHTGWHHITTEIEQKVLNEYRKGLNQENVANYLRVSRNTVKSVLVKYNENIRENTRHIKVNETVFDTITEDSAYWIGFLMADGCVSECSRGRYLCLWIKKSDESHVIKFRNFLESAHNLRYCKSRGYQGEGTVGLKIGSKRLCETLSKYGVVPNKTQNCKVVDELAYNRHFWRGMVDGDGWVCVYNETNQHHAGKPYIGFTGTKETCEQFVNFCKKICPKIKQKVTPNNSIWKVSFTSRIAANIINYLYCDCNVALDRKLEVVQNIVAKKWDLHPEEKWNLTEDLIKDWVRLYKEENGIFPHKATPELVSFTKDYGKMRWSLIDQALRHGYRGLKKGNSLSKLKMEIAI